MNLTLNPNDVMRLKVTFDGSQHKLIGLVNGSEVVSHTLGGANLGVGRAGMGGQLSTQGFGGESTWFFDNWCLVG